MKNMKGHIVLILLFLFIHVQHISGKGSIAATSTEKNITYLFIEWRHWNNTVVLGHFSSNRLKRIEEVVCDVDQLNEVMLRKWLKNPEQAALFSFHCMWGQQPWFHGLKYLTPFSEVLSTAEQSNIRTVISFIWHAGGFNYKKNWNSAFEKGSAIGKSLAAINQYYNRNSFIFCHSMGSRFFEGALHSMSTDKNLFKAVILFSADLPADIHQQEFRNIINSTDTVLLFKHQKDKPLLLSSKIFKCKRLGRSGPFPLTEANKIMIYDMTGYVKGLQHHAHINKRWPKEKLAGFFNRRY